MALYWNTIVVWCWFTNMAVPVPLFYHKQRIHFLVVHLLFMQSESRTSSVDCCVLWSLCSNNGEKYGHVLSQIRLYSSYLDVCQLRRFSMLLSMSITTLWNAVLATKTQYDLVMYFMGSCLPAYVYSYCC